MQLELSGSHFNNHVLERLQGMKIKEFEDSHKKFNANFVEIMRDTPCRDPLLGHDISKEYRTKMADWMIEVCTSFQCSQRTYFLSLAILDKYLIA